MCKIICVIVLVLIAITGYSCCVISGEADDMANEYSRNKIKEMQKKNSPVPEQDNH